MPKMVNTVIGNRKGYIVSHQISFLFPPFSLVLVLFNLEEDLQLHFERKAWQNRKLSNTDKIRDCDCFSLPVIASVCP